MVEWRQWRPPSKGPTHTLLHSVPRPCSRPRHRPAPEPPGHSQASLVSLLGGRCSFLLGPGAHKFLFVPSKSLFPESCVSSGGSLVGLMATSFKRAYAALRSAAPRASASAAGRGWPIPPQETLKHSSEINSKWIKDLNVRLETVKLLEENIGKTLSHINHSRILYDPPPRILEIKAKINGI